MRCNSGGGDGDGAPRDRCVGPLTLTLTLREREREEGRDPRRRERTYARAHTGAIHGRDARDDEDVVALPFAAADIGGDERERERKRVTHVTRLR